MPKTSLIWGCPLVVRLIYQAFLPFWMCLWVLLLAWTGSVDHNCQKNGLWWAKNHWVVCLGALWGLYGTFLLAEIGDFPKSRGRPPKGVGRRKITWVWRPLLKKHLTLWGYFQLCEVTKASFKACMTCGLFKGRLSHWVVAFETKYIVNHMRAVLALVSDRREGVQVKCCTLMQFNRSLRVVIVLLRCVDFARVPDHH